MQTTYKAVWGGLPAALVLGAALTLAGCCCCGGDCNTPVDLSRGPVPLRVPPPPPPPGACVSYEDSLTGGKIFDMYCAGCHNARPLAERPFSNYQNVAVHMRVRANLTGKEYAKLMAFLRRWHDVPPPNPPSPLEPPPKRLIFSQPLQELREKDKDKDKGKSGDKGTTPDKGATPDKEKTPNQEQLPMPRKEAPAQGQGQQAP
jgi:hypothetical protein